MRTKREIETCFAARADLDGVTSFFLVGIGGAGMSGIARMLHRRGFRVRGTDSTDGEGVHAVRALGIPVTLGHSASEIEAGDALVLTDAIDLQTSPEVARGVELGCKLFRRSQVLGWLLRDKKTIAVTGTHGKTTTTGMVGAALIAAGLDPTIVVGAEVPDFGGAVVEGSGEWAVIEACEAYDSLRDFDPTIALLTNLELDHVDFHGDWRGLERSVLDF
jgi:UDP-N-acetylmuramate--alanine ligase